MMSSSFTVRYQSEGQPGPDGEQPLMGTPRQGVAVAAMDAAARTQSDIRVHIDGDELVYVVVTTGAEVKSGIPDGTDEDGLREICGVMVDILEMVNAGHT